MTNLEHSGNAAAIVDLHQQIMSNARKSLDLAIQVGGLLREQRDKIQHGQWETWVETHLPFTPRTASTYMRLHRMRDQIKSESVSDLADAYKLLAGPAPMDRSEAARATARLRDCLHKLLAHVPPLIDHLRRIREQEAFVPDYPTFNAYLLDLGMIPEEFRAKERLCDALTAWNSGGSVFAVFKCLWPRQSDDEAVPWDEDE